MPRRQSQTVLKDSYGFVVKRDHHELFKQYAPIWAKEEVERASLWTTFLLSFAPDASRADASPADQLDAACAAGLEPFNAALNGWRAAQASGDDVEMPDWLPQLRCLVQAGVPRPLRGRLWQVFLCLEGKREAGLYDQLVQKALGNTKYGRKRSTMSGELDGAVPGDPGAATSEPPGSYRSQQSSSDAESQSTAYTPAAASAPVGLAASSADDVAADGADGAAPKAADADSPLAEADTAGGPAAAAPPESPVPGLAVRRTTSTTRMNSVSGSEGGRRTHRSSEPWHPSTNDWNVQIEKDLHRTFPGHPLMNRSGRGALRRILAAYSRRNEAVGYCQGMNFVAGTMLLFMDEEDAFWALVAVVEDLLPGYFAMDLIAPQVDQAVFKHLVDQRFPTLCAHLTRHGVNVSSMALNWFLTMFVTSLPLESTLRVWDVLFFDRCSSVLFRCALALVDIYAQALVATVDSIDAFTLLHAMAPMSFDASRLIDMACIAFAGLTMDQIQALRKAYRTTVVASKHDSSEDEDAAWASSDGEMGSADDEAVCDSPTGPTGSGEYYSGSDNDDASEDEAVTPSRLAQLSARATGRASDLNEVREYVHQIPSNELLAGNTARQEPTADLSPVSEVSTHAEKPSPSPVKMAHLGDSPVAAQRSDGGLHAASAAASAVSRRLDRIASAHGAASRRLFGRSRRSRKASASTGAAVLSSEAEELATAAVVHKSSAAAEAAYHIAATPFKTLPLARLEPGSTPLVEGITPEGGEGDSIDHRADSPSMTAALTGGQQQGSAAAAAAAAQPGNAAERARRHIEAASSVVARTIGEAFGRNRPAEPEAPEGSRHAAAMVQLLSVVEGLEEELFAAEAACHEAEVEAAAAVRHSADARKELDAAVGELQERARVVDLLHDKLMGVNNTLAFFDGELQAKEKALSGVRAQIAERDQQIAHKDALIAQLMQQSAKAGQLANGCPAPEVQKSAGSGGGGGGGIFSKLRTNLARGSSTNGEVASPVPTPTGSRKGSWSLRSGRTTGDAPDAAGKAADSGGTPAAPADPADTSPTSSGMRAATAAASANGKAPAAGPASPGSAEAGEEELQPRNLDEERPPSKDLDADLGGLESDGPQQPPQRRSQEQRPAAKDLDQLTREAQESATELHAKDLDAERGDKV